MTTTIERKDCKFPLGSVCVTRGVWEGIPDSEIQTVLRRHASGDWGTACPEDWEANDLALREGSRLLSSYVTEGGTKLWVITEADRSATTVLFPSEY
jgi:hypothetical protein